MIAPVLALALVVGLSPLPVVPAVLLLSSDKGQTNARVYLVAWLLGLTSLIGIAVLIGSLGKPYDDAEQSAGWLAIFVGALLLAFAAVKVLRERKGVLEPSQPPAWQASLAGYDSRRSARLGFLLALGNPKNVAAAFAAGAEIVLLSSSVGTTLVGIVGFVAIGSLGVATPILGAWLLGSRADDALASLRSFLERRGALLSVVVLGLLGVFLIVSGVTAAF